MRRKLISYEALDRIEKNSLSNAAHELTEAEGILSDLLESGPVSLHCYDGSNVYYQTTSGEYVRADYRFKEDGRITFENIESVVIDEDTHNVARRNIVKSMVEALVYDKRPQATQFFHDYLEMCSSKMKFGKGSRKKTAVEKMSSNMRGNMSEGSDADDVWGEGPKDSKRAEAAKKGHREHPGAAEKSRLTRKNHKLKIDAEHKKPAWLSAKKKADNFKSAGHKSARPKGKRYDEWLSVAGGVLQYIEDISRVPAIQESRIMRDDLGNVRGIVIPNSRLRNEGKLLALKWDTLKTDVKVLREQAMRLGLDESFQKAVAEVKRSNNLSDNDKLSDALSDLVSSFPSVLYLTQSELAKTVGEALANFGANNYDDSTCEFVAEGILRTAFDSYPDRVNRIANLANVNITKESDAYVAFQNAVQDFYPTVDSQMKVEMQVFEDLHTVFVDVRRAALAADSDVLRHHAANFIAQLESVLNGQAKPSLELAEEAAAYLVLIGEGNLEGGVWNVDKKPYRTTSGEHPDMAAKAAQPYSVSKDNGADSYGGKLPVSDGKSYRNGGEEEMRNRSWGQKGPEISNPYVPKEGKWTMPKDKGVDQETDSGLGQWQSTDTWPGLQNSNVPQSTVKYVNSDNRVDDVKSGVGLSQTSSLNQGYRG